MTRANFLTEVIKLYLLMMLLYPGELYRLLGASSYKVLFVFYRDVIGHLPLLVN
jgi:hypothetical protein